MEGGKFSHFKKCFLSFVRSLYQYTRRLLRKQYEYHTNIPYATSQNIYIGMWYYTKFRTPYPWGKLTAH